MSHHSRHNKTHEAHTSTRMASAATANDKSCAPQPDAGCCQSATDRIRARAYEISKVRNGGPGDALADWTQAEREVAAGRDAKT